MIENSHNTNGNGFRHEHWSSRFGFILAATGSAVGLGNIWKFPYVTGENGGGAFVLVYLACIFLIGLPIMMAEVLIGRRGQRSPIHSMGLVAAGEGASPGWRIVGWSGVVAGFIILSFYSVIAGWSLAYIFEAASGAFVNAGAERIGDVFGNLLENPGRLLFWHTLFMAMTVLVVAGGVRAGLERAVSVLMPLFFVLMLALVGYAALATDTFGKGAAFLFSPDFGKLSGETILVAMGQAFFSLSLGMGVMLAYGSYLPKTVSIGRSVFAICIADTLVALIAGLAIFPLVFAHGLEPGGGPGLVFKTLPLAFGQMGGGVLFGTLFFVLLVVAGWTSSISILEPTVQWMEERFGIRRPVTALLAGLAAWVLGLATVFSFNVWAEFKLWDKTPFELLDYLTSNIMLPLGGLLFALFAGWIMTRDSTREELGFGNDGLYFRLWRFLVRYVAPVGIVLVVLHSLGFIGTIILASVIGFGIGVVKVCGFQQECGIMNWYLEVLKKYAVFNGRARRKEYWYFFLFNVIITIALATIDAMTGSFSPEAGLGLLGAIYVLAIFIPNLAVSVRRLHDTDRSGWWLLIGLIPVVGPIVLIVFLVLDSQPGENRFGANPKGATA